MASGTACRSTDGGGHSEICYALALDCLFVRHVSFRQLGGLLDPGWAKGNGLWLGRWKRRKAGWRSTVGRIHGGAAMGKDLKSLEGPVCTAVPVARPHKLLIAVMVAVALLAVVSQTQPADAASPSIVFDGSPGTSSPPSTLGPYNMIAFSADARAEEGLVSNVPDPAGTITFSEAITHLRVPGSWATWSHGYTGDVYHVDDASVTITLPSNTKAFYLYAEPNPFATFNMTATAQDGTTSGSIAVDGLAGAKYFGFYATSGKTIVSIEVSSTVDFAIGEFGISRGRSGETTHQDEAVEIVKSIIEYTDLVCRIQDCPGYAASIFGRVMQVISRFATLLNLGTAIALIPQVAEDLDDLNEAVETYGRDSVEAEIAAHQLCLSNQNLHRALVSIVPGLSFVFPVPPCD